MKARMLFLALAILTTGCQTVNVNNNPTATRELKAGVDYKPTAKSQGVEAITASLSLSMKW